MSGITQMKRCKKNIGTARINNSRYEKLLGIKIDLSSNDHIGNIYKKAGAKLRALTRVAQYINTEKNAELGRHFFVTI